MRKANEWLRLTTTICGILSACLIIIIAFKYSKLFTPSGNGLAYACVALAGSSVSLVFVRLYLLRQQINALPVDLPSHIRDRLENAGIHIAMSAMFAVLSLALLGLLGGFTIEDLLRR